MTTQDAVDEDLSRAAVIARIKAALERRSGKRWSVTGGTGTAYGWITVNAPPARRTWEWRLKAGALDYPGNYGEHNTGQRGGHSSPEDRAELAKLLGLDGIHFQGLSIAASSEYRREYVDRAEGRVPRKIATPYWD